MDLFNYFFTKATGGGDQPSPSKKEIPVDPNSLKPLEFGIDADGFFFSDTAGTGNAVALGRDSDGIYAAGGVT